MVGLSACSDAVDNELIEEPILTFEDIHGQWSRVDIDTVWEKQDLVLNEYFNSIGYEFPTSEIIPVDGVLKCVSLCPQEVWKKEIEFTDDTLYEYDLPIRLITSRKITITNNIIKCDTSDMGWIMTNNIWTNATDPITVSINEDHDTLRVEYLEETGLYLRELYSRDRFDSSLVYILKNFRENLPEASGTYSLVHYYFESVDYDSPFEHFHSFPYEIPETLELSKDDLLEVLKNNRTFELSTDGELKRYELSWGWDENITLMPENWLYHPDSTWYVGPDTSMNIWYRRVEE